MVFLTSLKILFAQLHYLLCSGDKNGGYLVEANLLVEERHLPRDVPLAYCYGVKRRQKEIQQEDAVRRIQINSNINGEAS